MSVKKIIKGIGYTCCAAVLAAAVYAFAVNGCVIYKTGSYILNADEAAVLSDVDCILVLGAAVKPDKTPSNMLYDRIMTGVNLYKLGASKDIIMSGDHGSNDYNEVETMKKYAIASGVPSNAIYMDHAGFSTYDSLYRARNIFGVNKNYYCFPEIPSVQGNIPCQVTWHGGLRSSGRFKKLFRTIQKGNPRNTCKKQGFYSRKNKATIKISW